MVKEKIIPLKEAPIISLLMVLFPMGVSVFLGYQTYLGNAVIGNTWVSYGAALFSFFAGLLIGAASLDIAHDSFLYQVLSCLAIIGFLCFMGLWQYSEIEVKGNTLPWFHQLNKSDFIRIILSALSLGGLFYIIANILKGKK